MNHMDMAREIVNVFYRARNRTSEDFAVRVTYEPNPLNFDGMDTVYASVVRIERIGKWSPNVSPQLTETVILSSPASATVEEALTWIQTSLNR